MNFFKQMFCTAKTLELPRIAESYFQYTESTDECRTKKYFQYAENMIPLFLAILMNFFADSLQFNRSHKVSINIEDAPEFL